MTRGAKIAIGAGIVSLVALAIVSRLSPKAGRDPALAMAEEADDQRRLKQLAMYVVLRTDVPLTKGGQLDLYRIVLDVEPNERAVVDLCFSSRARQGPTIEEIKAGDYRRFPYARVSGRFELRDRNATALLWDPSPQERGQRLVALDDGSCRTVKEADFAAFLEAHER